MIDKLIESLKRKKRELPKHIALDYSFSNHINTKIPATQYFKNKFMKLKEFIDAQLQYEIPVFTIYILPSMEKESIHFSAIMEALPFFFDELSKEKKIFEKKVKVSVLGKWYNLPSKGVESIKKIIEETKDYDSFFLNFCIKYDGQEEIVDASKVIARKIKAGKLDPDAITKDAIKENLYSSYFLPPELIIVIDGKKELSGFLLWDSINSQVYFSEKQWNEFSQNDLLKAVAHWKKWKSKRV